jgi:uncharacterized membrane protein
MHLLLLFQTAIAITGTETIALMIAGFVASFIMSTLKRAVNGQESWANKVLKGAWAHFIMLVLAVAIALVAMWYEGQLHSLNDVIKSMSIVVTSAVTTYHFLIDKFGLVEHPNPDKQP